MTPLIMATNKFCCCLDAGQWLMCAAGLQSVGEKI